jgi:asparagine synthase (glutamine-hydrolysing)
MCGIAGIISLNEPVEIHQLKQMTDAIAHRGPDGEGHWLNDGKTVGLGHRRLSIIDLSDDGKQPMHFADGRFTITYNGEIYNYLELKEQLLAKGVKFRSNSDTEVLLALYAEKGTSCLNELDGMFAFAIWDEKEKTLFCARDRFGEKPFYFHHQQGKKFCFSSEMKALFALGVKKEVKPEMVFNFFNNVSSLSDPQHPSETFFKSIHKLEPAHYLIVNRNLSVTKKRYWAINVKADAKPISETDAIQKMRELLLNSVKVRLRSDVPVGSSLSGGIDSSTIVCLIDQLNSENKITQKTFSARFKDFDKDEGKYIELVTAKTKAESFYTWPDEQVFIDDFDKLMYHQEEPFGTSNIIAQWSVMKLAKEHNVTVLLDGQGADEILAGYPYYCKTYLNELYKKHSTLYPQELVGYRNIHDPDFMGYSGDANKVFGSSGSMFKKSIQAKIAPLYNAIAPEKKEANAKKFLHPHYTEQFTKKDIHSYHFDGNLKEQLYSSTFVHGLEDLLRFADRSSMAFSREVRLPFLNYKLVEFAFGLPSSFKINSGWTKYLLRKSFESILPNEITWRKDKIGYASPQQKWLQSGKVKDWVQESKNKLETEKILNPTRDKTQDNDWMFLMAAKFMFK